MLKNYLKIAVRNLFRNKGYSFIQITGLSIGLWACIMVATVVIDDLSYDKTWSRNNDLYRIISVNKMGEDLHERSASSFAGLAPQLKRNYPEVESYSEFYTGDLHLKLKEGEQNGVKVMALHADSTFWGMLDIEVLAGNPRKFVADNSNLLISRSFKEKFFPGQDPVGKVIYDVPAYSTKPKPFLITGIIEDLPGNSHLRADVIWVHKGRVEELNPKGYGSFSQNYILMRPGTNMAGFTAKVNKWYKGFVTEKRTYHFEFQPMTDVYLHSDFANYQTVKGNADNVYIFSGVAILLLFIACVNFVNLSTGRTFTRLRETGVRKVLSASRYQIILQYMTEAMLYFGISAVLATFLYYFSVLPVENFLGYHLVKTYLTNLPFTIFTLAAIFLTGLLTGLYPAWLMSGFKPANTLKGIFSSSGSYRQNWLRQGLVVSQFSISVVVLLIMLMVRQQLHFLEGKDIGFNPDNLLNIDFISWEKKGDAFKNALLRFSGVESASMTQWIPSQGAGYMSKDVEDPADPGKKVKVWYISGDVNLAETMGFRLKSGRLLSKKFTTDALNADSLQNVSWEKYEEETSRQVSMISASAARILKVKELNKQIPKANTVPVGIIEDFNNESLREPIKPTVIIAQRSSDYGGMLIRIKPGTEKNVMASLQKIWKQFYPDKLLEMNMVKDMLNKQYEAESKLQSIFMFFSSLTMFLAALGIFGLVVQAAEQRTKEIGIRKVLGASIAGIVALLSKDFIKLVLVAVVIASPVAWYAMEKWLQGFAYRIEISWTTFLIGGATALITAFITLSFQSIKAALMNPVKSLKSE
ncbi:ABC transporter permease [Dyadobacter psychrotolerans]|uniref:ABC transporter permease n=1 Tax=Dyadobacter psychrotolerans TaxID=2541721 RepID=A0A4R5E2T5_9BACT|nr:ABC transporter permease [Dyadobacter psychrotolerans]TDE18543.1 ABC transporter permease [Dyadobacter psychrotolerans]